LGRAHGRTETDDVAVGIDQHALVFAPFSALWSVDLRAGGPPLDCDRVGVCDEDVRHGGMAIDVGDSPEVDLDSVAAGEALVAAAGIWLHVEAESGVEVQRGAEVADGKDRRGPAEHDRDQSGYSSLRQARGSSGPAFGVRSSRNEWYGATNRSGAITV
jgi:hypothetical protein